MNKEKIYGVLADLFTTEYSALDYQMLRLTAHHHMTQFMRGVDEGYIKIDDDLTPFSNNPVLDQWVGDNDGMLSDLVQEIQSYILAAVQFALPAHDERQILFKDAAEGLRFYQMEKPQGYKSTFVIPMNFHDWGRLLEGRLHDPVKNPPDNWIPHSHLSFMMLKRTLDQPQYATMPKELKNHFLYAVLAHSGDNGKSYMSRAVQTCDRMQLIGAEGFYRALSYGVCLMDGKIKYPDDPSYQYALPDTFDDHKSVLSLLEYCARNMRENIGDRHASWQRHSAVENIALLKAACDGDEELTHRMFAPEFDMVGAFSLNKRKIDADILKEASDLYASSKSHVNLRWSPYEIASTAIEAIEMPAGAARLSDDMKGSIRRACGEMSEDQRKALFRMMSMADVFRAAQDNIDRNICLTLANDPRAYVRTIVTKALTYTESPVIHLMQNATPQVAHEGLSLIPVMPS